MKATELETKDAGYFKFAAMRDASMKSYAASTSYSEQQKVQAERMRLGLELVYGGKAFYITFRKKFVVIKVDGAYVKDRKSLSLLEKDYESRGVTKTVTAQGVSYRMAKA
jgi:hypothetical protein